MMKSKRRAFFIAFLAAIFGGQFAATTAEASPMIELKIEGADGQSFNGDCTYQQRLGSSKKQRISGKSPTRILFPATTLRCNIQKSKIDGFFKLSIIRGAVVEVTQNSRYPFKWIFIESKGPWGAPSGGAYPSRPTYR